MTIYCRVYNALKTWEILRTVPRAREIQTRAVGHSFVSLAQMAQMERKIDRVVPVLSIPDDLMAKVCEVSRYIKSVMK